jgi:predicted PP-loop superfamily ATPase
MDESIEYIRCLIKKFGSDVALVVNHSGGKDSTRMLGVIREIFPLCTTYGVMAGTLCEHQRPISAVDRARSRCEEFGVTLSVVRNPKRTYLEMVEQRRMFPSAHVPPMHIGSEARSDRQVHSRVARTSHRELHWHPCGRIESPIETHILESERKAHNTAKNGVQLATHF